MKPWVHRITLAVGALVLLASTLFLLLRWQTLPELVPVRYDAAGLVASYGGRDSLAMLQFLGWLAFLGLRLASRFPSMGKQGGAFRVSVFRVGLQAGRSYGRPVDPITLDLLSVVLALIFSYLTVCAALGRALGVWFFPSALAVLVVISIVGVVRTLRK